MRSITKTRVPKYDEGNLALWLITLGIILGTLIALAL